jgi:RNA polymerase sigma-70 factor (ECF subfamily)
MYAIARHKLIDLLRRRGRHERLLEPLDELPEAMHPVAVGEPLARRDLAVLLDELPAAQRQAILDTKIEGLSVADAAQRGGVSESAVKVNVHRGLKRLAKMIQEQP